MEVKNGFTVWIVCLKVEKKSVKIYVNVRLTLSSNKNESESESKLQDLHEIENLVYEAIVGHMPFGVWRRICVQPAWG